MGSNSGLPIAIIWAITASGTDKFPNSPIYFFGFADLASASIVELDESRVLFVYSKLLDTAEICCPRLNRQVDKGLRLRSQRASDLGDKNTVEKPGCQLVPDVIPMAVVRKVVFRAVPSRIKKRRIKIKKWNSPLATKSPQN